jgi:hypothetical protein
MSGAGAEAAGTEYRNRLWRPSRRQLVVVWLLLLVLWNGVLVRLVQTGQLTDPLVIAESAVLGVAFTAAGYWGGNELLRLFAEPVTLAVGTGPLRVRYEARDGTTEVPVPWDSIESVSWRVTRAGLAAFRLKSEEARWGGFLFVTERAFLDDLGRHVAADRLHRLDKE